MAFIVRPVRPNVFFISVGGGLVDMKHLVGFLTEMSDKMPNHCSCSDYVLSNSRREMLMHANSMPRFRSHDSQIARTPLKNARNVFWRPTKNVENAYRLRKKCAVNVHFIKKDRESDRYNYFHFSEIAG